MHKYQFKSKIAFCISLISVLLGPIFVPKLHLFYFVPYIILCLYQHAKIAALWRALLCGVILDLLSSGPFFGFSALQYCCVAWVLYDQKRNFFEDKVSTLPLMTFLFSFAVTVMWLAMMLFGGKSHVFSLTWLMTDLIVMPLVDATYALLVFSLPFQLIYRFRKLRIFT